MHTISQLFIYPVKSLGGISLQKARLDERGLKYDRRWMLIDGNNRFISQRELPRLALLQTAIEPETLIITDVNEPGEKLRLPLEPASGTVLSVTVWDDTCEAWHIDEKADEWLSRKLSVPCKLVYMPAHSKRLVDQRYAFNNEITGFADGYPLLMIGNQSLSDLNNRLATPLSMDRFRPNIVFDGGMPYDEDLMEEFSINGINMSGVKLCARCVITCTDQSTGEKSKEPLHTLSAYRVLNNKIYFGQNVIHSGTGIISVGDQLFVTKQKTAVSFITKTGGATDE